MGIFYIFKNFINSFIKNGQRVTYYLSGQIRFKENYKDGKLNGDWVSYYKNGQIKEKKSYLIGEDGFSRENGSYLSYYDNGQLKFSCYYLKPRSPINFDDEILDGECIHYDKDGKVISKCIYKDRRRWEGEFEDFDFFEIDDGEPYSIWFYTYEEGKIISSKQEIYN